MSVKEILFNTNPFIQRAFYVEKPFEYIIDHWITKKFGFKAFKTKNKSDVFIYFIIHDNMCVKATQEFLEDTENAILVFSKLKSI